MKKGKCELKIHTQVCVATPNLSCTKSSGMVKIMKMHIDDNMMNHICHLSKLELTSEEKKQAKTDMTRLCAFFDQLKELEVLQYQDRRDEDLTDRQLREDLLINDITERTPQEIEGDSQQNKPQYTEPGIEQNLVQDSSRQLPKDITGNIKSKRGDCLSEIKKKSYEVPITV